MPLPEPLSTIEDRPIQRRFAALIAPKTQAELEAMAAGSRALTLRHFGRTIRMFAPLYLSNECINSCKYCGFARGNPIQRVTLEIEDMAREARHLALEGYRKSSWSRARPEVCIQWLPGTMHRPASGDFPSISLEVGPLETAEYMPLVRAGAEGLVVFQETSPGDV